MYLRVVIITEEYVLHVVSFSFKWKIDEINWLLL